MPNVPTIIINGATERYGPAVVVQAGTPAGLGHLANLSHLVQGSLPGPNVVAVSAQVVTDDVRIITSDWRMPGRLPVYGSTPKPVRRLSATFTPEHFSADIEYARRDFTPDPHASWSGSKPTFGEDGVITVDSAPPGAPGGAVLVCLTEMDNPNDGAPAYGHVLPSGAPYWIWLPDLLANNVPQGIAPRVTDITGISLPYSFQIGQALRQGTYGLSRLWDPSGPVGGYPGPLGLYMASVYFTDVTHLWTFEGGWPNASSPSIPRDVDMWDESARAARWTYPWTMQANVTSFPPAPELPPEDP